MRHSKFKTLIRAQIAWLAISLAQADDCSTIQNLAEDLGPSYNQHCTNWCYSFTATDLMSQRLQKTGVLKKGERLHPLAVAGARFLVENKDPNVSKSEGGSPDDVFGAINGALISGESLCKESELGPNTGPDSPIFKMSEANAMKVFRQAVKTSPVDSCNLNLQTLSQLRNLSDEINLASRKSWIATLKTKCKTRSSPFSWVNHLEQTRYDHLNTPNPVMDDLQAGKRLVQSLDLALQNKAMAGVLINTDFLKDPKRTPSPAQINCREKLDKSERLHWASIVARRRNEAGVCEYLLRNSWGTSCEGFRNPQKCKEGFHWISRDQVIQNLANVQYLN